MILLGLCSCILTKLLKKRIHFSATFGPSQFIFWSKILLCTKNVMYKISSCELLPLQCSAVQQDDPRSSFAL